MAELAQYRSFKGLAQYPMANEHTPLVLPIGKQIKALSRAALHLIVKEIFTLTAQRIRAKGSAYEAEAQHVEQASAHWLRHTAGSHMLGNKVDLLHVRDTLGHGSISTTNRYLHSADDDRHDATEDSHKIKW
ncbi:tyrosine-type recombinase/integrase [Paenalcaligenes niemegkensis]|uniref:tyrosine-type recombinase/integrase n=1 Tax=Paenalcaligenes niemegkensis TaxID=2895469 RepID=UPI001EE7D1E3|nr:tyrosine-type recombinase/integrase [Paenalcaligenes niemegkensis]MCQ9616318.1 tyrosine-type recombinase/integrase [Paenalcaligenes niemegkensis]